MNTNTGPGDIEVVQSSVALTPNLEAMWCELQERADASMFISWSWIGTWLASVPASIDVQASREGIDVR